MKKNHYILKITFSILSLTVLTDFISCTKKSERENTVVVYTYDSFAGEWGPGAKMAELFKEKTGLTVNFVDCGDAVQAFNRAVLEKDSPNADIVLGIDNNLADEAKKSELFISYIPKEASNLVSEDLVNDLGGSWILTPFDYSHFAIIYDTASSIPEPEHLSDLTKDIYRKKIILMDPRTSTPGLGFLAWTVSEWPETYNEYWEALKPNILTMTPGWSAGWGMFLAGEAPLVVSYTSSPAYNVEIENDMRYKALIFSEGHVQQVEGAGILKSAQNMSGAKKFIDFLISREAQELIPLTQWMYPVNKNVRLPESYNIAAPVPEKTLLTDSKNTNKAVEEVIDILNRR